MKLIKLNEYGFGVTVSGWVFGLTAILAAIGAFFLLSGIFG